MTIESAGGIFQYGQTMLDVIAELRATRSEEFVVLGDNLHAGDPLLGGHEWEIARLTPTTPARELLARCRRVVRDQLSVDQREALLKAYARLRGQNEVPPPRRPERRRGVQAWLRSLGIDLVLYPAPLPIVLEAGIPFVMAVHDLQHRLHPEFPEVSADGEWEYREYLFRNGIGEATLVVTDSEIGREDVLSLYGDLIGPERVAMLPFLPATPAAVRPEDRQRVRRAHRLPERYLFYPAQLWPHKNHLRLVEALGALARDGLNVDLVLVGSRSGPVRERVWTELTRRAHELSIQSRIRHLGYVAAEDLPALYAEAVALVMPTFFGPTNIPVLEAWGLGCPVLTSDIRGVREQAGDAAVLADPYSVDAIAEGIRQLWLEEDLRRDIAARGSARLSLYTRDDYADRLGAILDQATRLIGLPALQSEKP
jgi:glycosyltransferase involved in cell wall biosynthesis